MEDTSLETTNQELTDAKVNEEVKEKRFNNNFDVKSLLNTAGTLDITPEQEAVLFAPVNVADVEIRPDGLIYLPWMEYVTRLRNAFKCGWSIIPNGMPEMGTKTDDYGNEKQIVLWGFYLIIKGKIMGYAIGEQEYQPKNGTMSYTDACEGAKSNALMRLCKGIGITLELWKPSFIREWKEKNAYSFQATDYKTGKPAVDKYGKPKLVWKKGKPNNKPNQNTQPAVNETDNAQETKPDPKPENPKNKIICEVCKKEINDVPAVEYSLKNYGKPAHRQCQKGLKKI